MDFNRYNSLHNCIFPTKKVPICGARICDKEENCLTCLKDCKCLTIEYYSEKVKSCVKADLR